MSAEERRRGARAWDLRGGGAKVVEPVVYFDGDGKRAICGVGVEVGRLMIGFEARAWPGSPAFRVIVAFDGWRRRRDARREGAVP
jgi:hypothetical protein